ncbi:MAG: autotransporter domain-containing protein [Planctomycetaceae bacterium]|nr:autotransporter domain-containing protein [Planctomycetaceae bacterium]
MSAGTLTFGNDKSLGTYVTNTTTPTDSQGQLTATGNATIIINNDRTLSNRFVVNPNNSLIFNSTTGNTLTINGVTNIGTANNGYGGAIQIDAVDVHGGLFFESVDNSGKLIIQNNEANFGGGIGSSLASGSVNLNFDPIETKHFSYNKAAESGGAFYLGSSDGSYLYLGENNLFNANQATTGNGGAIFSNHVFIAGNSLLKDNLASGKGGAIYASGIKTNQVVVLNTEQGNIAFTGNQSDVTNFMTPDGNPNSIHFVQNTTLLVSGNNNIYFDDPISSGTTGNNSFAKFYGTGFVQFLGSNRLNTTGFTGTNSVDNYAGTFRLADNADFDASGAGIFNVSTNATLSGNGTITSSSDGFTVAGTISPDSERFAIPNFDTTTNTFGTAVTTIADANKIGTLHLIGNVQLNSATLRIDTATGNNSDKIIVAGDVGLNGTITIDFNSLHENGTFEIVQASGTMSPSPTLNFQLNGNNLTGSRVTGYLSGIVNENVLSVTLSAPAQNTVSAWNGSGTGTADWNLSAANWDNGLNSQFLGQFLDGDAVTFTNVNGRDASTSQTITIDGTEKTVAEMTVGGAETNLAFNGKIVTNGTQTTLASNNSGKLILDSSLGSTGQITLNNENEFTNGMTMSGGKLIIENNKSLGTYATDTTTPADSQGQLTATQTGSNAATVTFNDSRIIKNRFVVDPTGSLTFDIATGKTLTIDSVQNTATGNDGVGGAIQVNASGNDKLRFTGNAALTLQNNEAENGGGVGSFHASGNSSLDFSGLTALRFLNNNASQNGGAVFTGSSATFFGNTLFQNNLAGENGGAIYADGNGTNNTITLNTANGNIAFTGNRKNVTNVSVPNGSANSVHLEKNTALNIFGNNNVYFDDPISSGTANAGNSFTKNGNGFVQFAGNNRLNTDGSNVTNTVDIQAGMFRVADGAVFDASGAGMFNVATNAVLAGQGQVIAGSNGFKINGTISPDSDRFEIPNFSTTTNSFETARTTIDNAKKYGTLTLDGNVQLDGATLQVDLSTASAYDTINITGTVTFGTNKNIIEVDSWDAGNFSIFSAASIAGVTPNDQFSVEWQGQTLSANDYVLSYINNNSVLNLQTFKDQKPDNFYVWDEETDHGGNLNNDDNFPNNVIVHYSGDGLEDVTVNDQVELAGLVVSTSSDYHFHGQTKDSNASIIITENPNFTDQRFNGKLAVIGNSTVDLDVAIDAINGNYFQDSTVTISNSNALGTFKQDENDETKSAGQTTVAGNVTLEINGNIETETRFVVAENAALNITGNAENAVKFSGVNAENINGAAFSLESGSSLSISGNTVIADNKTSGEGGGIYAKNSTVVLDSSEGGIEITDNIDTTTTSSARSSDIVLAGEENIITAVGKNETTTGTVIGSINAATDSSGNKLVIDTDSFLQTGESKLNDKPSANPSDNEVIVSKGQWHVLDTFDVGGSLIYVDKNGTITGSGTPTSSDYKIYGHLSPDNAELSATTTVIRRDQQIGTLTLAGTNITFDGAQIDVELIGTQSDKIVVSGNLNYGTNKNIINVNSWANGTNFTVLENSTIDASKFTARIGNEEIPTNYTRTLTLELQKSGNSLILSTSAPENEIKRLRWTGNSNNYIDMASDNNWVDDYGEPVQLAPGDFLEFDSTGKQGEIILGTTDNSIGGRTVSGTKITGGNYTFTGGSLFGVGTTTTPANLTIADGNVEFQNHVFFDGNIQLLNGSKTTLSNKKAFHAEGDFSLAQTAALIIEVGNDIIRGKSVTLNGAVSVINEPVPTTHRPHVFSNMITATETPLDTGQLNTIFNNTKGLIKREAVISTDSNENYVMDLKYNAIPLTVYADEHHFTKNQGALAAYFEQTFNRWEHENFELELMKLNDTELDIMFDDLAGAAIHAEAKHLALTNPYRIIARYGNRQNENTQRYNYKTLIRSQCSKRTPSTQQLWFTVQHREIEQQSDGNAPQFNISRTSMMLGGDWKMTPELLIGGVFGYGNPKLFQVGNEIKAEDYTFGIYAQTKLNTHLILNGFFGYGNQSYQGKRRTLNTLVHSDYDGNAVFSTLELIRKLTISNNIVLLPTLAADYQQARTEDFIETKSDLLQYHFKNSNIDQFIIRFGLNSRWNVSKNIDWETRLQYGRRLDNNKGTQIQSTIADSSAAPMRLYGVNGGRDLFNFGFGGQYRFGKSDRITAFGHYDFDRWNRSKSHTAELGFFLNR